MQIPNETVYKIEADVLVAIDNSNQGNIKKKEQYRNTVFPDTAATGHFIQKKLPRKATPA